MGNQLLMQRGAGVNWSQWFDHFWQAKGALSYAASLLDLVGAQNLVEGNGAVPWAALTGWGFVAGSAQWLDTVLIPADNWSMLVQFANVVTASDWLCGSYDVGTPERFDIAPNDSGTDVIYGHGTAGNRNIVAPPHLAGNLGVAGKQPYRDGLADGAAIAAGAGTYTRTIYIGDINSLAGRNITADIYALGIKKGPELTAGEVAAAAAAMAAI
jgi:hypothetical protein